MTRSAVALLICLALACVSYAHQNDADAPASKEDIQRYMDTMHMRDMMTNMMQTMKPAMHRMFQDQIKDLPSVPPDFQARIEKMMDTTLDSIPVDEFLDAMAPIYQKYLTKGDVAALTAFYGTPTGQKILKETPAMTAEAMGASSGIMKKAMATMQEQVKEQIAQMQKQNGNSKDRN